MQKKINWNLCLLNSLKEGVYFGFLILIIYLFLFNKDFSILSLFLIFLFSILLAFLAEIKKIFLDTKIKNPFLKFLFGPNEIHWNYGLIFIFISITLLTYILFGRIIGILTMILLIMLFAIKQNLFKKIKKKKR